MASVSDVEMGSMKAKQGDVDVAVRHVDGAQIECKDTSFTVVGTKKEKIQILKNLNITFYPGQLTALMGPSGAGKTTLLNVLGGRASGIVNGKITVDDGPLNPSKMKMITNVVPQHDILLGCLTARQALGYAADMRLGCSAAEKQKKIDSVLSELSLTEVADVLIGNEEIKGLSGGQKKRVSIALELLTEPKVLFLDEPTSGLDSKVAEDVVNVLKRLALGGRTIICTIHQPSDKVFKTFDRLVLLKKGELVYNNLVSLVPKYFDYIGLPSIAGTTLAEHFFNILSLDKPSEKFTSFTAAFMSWPNASSTSALLSSPTGGSRAASVPGSPKILGGVSDDTTYEASWFAQFGALFRRTGYKTLRNKMEFRVRLGQVVFISILIGSIYWQLPNTQQNFQNRLSVLFLLVMMTAMTTIMGTITTMPVDKGIFLKEYRNGYYPTSAYFAAILLNNMLFQAVYGCLLAAITYFIIGFNPSTEAFLSYLAVITLIGAIGNLMGFAAGSFFSDVTAAISTVPMMLQPLTMFSGLLIRPGDIPLWWKWMYYLSFFQYAFQILVVNEFNGRTFDPCDIKTLGPAKCPFGPCAIKNATDPYGRFGEPQGCPGSMVLEVQDYNLDDQAMNWGILLALFGGLFVIAWGAMIRLSRTPV